MLKVFIKKQAKQANHDLVLDLISIIFPSNKTPSEPAFMFVELEANKINNNLIDLTLIVVVVNDEDNLTRTIHTYMSQYVVDRTDDSVTCYVLDTSLDRIMKVTNQFSFLVALCV